MFQAVAKEIKEEILHQVKHEGLSVTKASERYGVATNTIYTWLSRQNAKAPSVLELARLKRENQQLKEIIGVVTLELEKLKRGQR